MVYVLGKNCGQKMVASTFDVKINATHTIKTASTSNTAITLNYGPLKANVRELSESETWNNFRPFGRNED